MKLAKLIRLMVFKNIRNERFLTVLSIIGVALGIGLFIGVKVASDRALLSFEDDVKGIEQNTNYEILDISGIDFDEQVYGRILRIEENSFPALKVNGYIPGIKESVSINGIDTVKSIRFLRSSRDMKFDVRDLYRDLNAILITKKLSDMYSLKKGSALDVLVYDKKCTLKVIGVLSADTLPADTVIMDIGNFQEYFGKTGLLSIIDLKTSEKGAETIQKTLPPNLSIESKTDLLKSRKSLITSFKYNLQFISLIAILVGMFLLYNTIFISVVKRRTEIGILRGLGADKKTIVILFVVQGLLLGLAGSLLGIAMGQVIAYFSVFAVERTISTMYSSISVSDYLISWGDSGTALVLGLLVSLAASAIPAYESSKIKPNESSKEGSFESKYKGYQKAFSFLGLCLIPAGGILSYLDYRFTPFDFPFLSYLGILLIILGFAFASPFYLSTVLKAVKKPSGRLFKATGKIANGDMQGNLYRFSVALMSVAISCALIVSLLTLIFSFRNSLKAWLGRNIYADVYVKPASCTSNFCFYPLSEEVVKILKGFPEVAGVDKFRTLHIDLFGRKVVVGFGDISVQRKYSPSHYYDPRSKERYQGLEDKKRLSISRYLSSKYGLKKGDTLELQTPKGKESFEINDVFSSYSTTSGFIYMDRKWLKKYWGLDDATQVAIYLKKGVDPAQFIRKVKDTVSGRYSLEIMDNNEIRKKVLNIFNKTFSITYAIELISIIVSLIGVLNTLMALVLERKREISIIRYLGGSWQQIKQVLILSAGIVGIAGIFLGAIMGLLMSIIFIQVVNKISFGWEIRFQIPFSYLFLITSVLFLATLLAGMLPAKVARKIDPKRFISFE